MADLARDEIRIPADLVPAVLATEDLAELKVILHVLRLARGARAVGADALGEPAVLQSIAGPTSPEPAEHRLHRALERAVSNGALLRVTATAGDRNRSYLLPATRDAERLIDRVRASDSGAAAEAGIPPGGELVIYRPNVFALYERHIGPLTPLVAEQLRDAERAYPRAWIEDAILTAAQNKRHNWRYVEAILARWEEYGAPGAVPGR